MPLFRRKAETPTKSLDELIEDAKGFVERARPGLEPEEDLVPTVLTDHEINALALPGPELERALAEIARKSRRFVFWATAWQAEGVDDPSTRASEHPDRFEVVVVQAYDNEAGRQENWRARLSRRADQAPELGEWERIE